MKNQILLALAAVDASASSRPARCPSSTSCRTKPRRSNPAPTSRWCRPIAPGCHSSDYVNTQPRNVKSKKDFWQAEVTKMIKVYGAPIEDADVPKIVEYLAATY